MFKSSFNSIALIVLAAACSLLPAQATPIIFTPNGDSNAGSLKCDVPLSSLGTLPLKGGSASISGKVVTIKASSAYIDAPRTVLVGSVLKTESNLTSEPPNITGLALFLMGDWKDQIDDGNTKDMIFRKEGHVDGRILGVENDALSVNINGIPQHIPLASILYIRSPRVFVFKVALKSKQALAKDAVLQVDAGDASFRPTASPRTLSGSVIPDRDKKEDGVGNIMSVRNSGVDDAGGGGGPFGGMSGVPGLGGSNAMGGMGGYSPGMGTMNRPNTNTAVPNPKDDSFDQGDEQNKFGTIQTKWGSERMSLPAGILGQ